MKANRGFTMAVLAALALTLGASGAKADNVDFTCALGGIEHCSGTVTQSGSNFSTTGISVFNDSGPYAANVPFTLVFDTGTGQVSIDGTGIYAGEDLIGTITGFSSLVGGTTSTVSFTTLWPTLPAAVQGKLGTAEGIDTGFVIYLKTTGAAQSVDVIITPVPEPASLSWAAAALGLALVGIAEAGRRRRRLSRQVVQT